MKNYLRALAFLTVIPLPFVRFEADGRELSQAAASFPLAGATLGLLLAGLAWLWLHFLPPAPVTAGVLAASFLLTRGLHLDGLADTADGLIGTTGREKAFKAMEDSATGVMGVVSILLVILLKYALLANMGRTYILPALFFMPLAGRWAIVYGGAWFPPAKSDGLGDMFLRGLRLPVLLKASLGAVIISASALWWQPQLLWPALAGCALALAAAHLLAFYATRRLGGLNGDILGASCELGELFFLIGYYLLLQPGTSVAL